MGFLVALRSSSSGRRWARRRWWLAASVVVVLTAAVLCGALAWRECQPDRRFARALAALEVGDWDTLARQIDALEASPGFEPHAHFLHGVLRLEAGKYYAALEEFGHAVDHPELRVRTLTLSGRALYQVRELGPAIRLLSQAVQREPDAIEAHRWLALAYYYLGMTREATAHLLRVAELAPEDPRPYRFLAMIEKDFEQYPAAVDDYQEAFRRKDQHLLDRQEALLELAECQIKVQQDEAALETLAQAAPSARRWFLEAECHRRANRNDQAERLVDQALAEKPAHLQGLLLKSDLLMARGDVRAAVEWARRAVTAYPKDYTACAKLMQAYRRLGDEARVKELAATADELKRLRTEFAQLHETAAAEPNNADVRCRLGVLARALDRPDLARGWFEAALAINPRHDEARRHLAVGGSATGVSGAPPRR